MTATIGTEKFQKEITPYRSAKSTARFPLDEPIPFALISQLVKFRVKENRAQATREFNQPREHENDT
jgi:uncharacterized protein YdhG (YjbR/CyaY superfamily)